MTDIQYTIDSAEDEDNDGEHECNLKKLKLKTIVKIIKKLVKTTVWNKHEENDEDEYGNSGEYYEEGSEDLWK